MIQFTRPTSCLWFLLLFLIYIPVASASAEFPPNDDDNDDQHALAMAAAAAGEDGALDPDVEAIPEIVSVGAGGNGGDAPGGPGGALPTPLNLLDFPNEILVRILWWTDPLTRNMVGLACRLLHVCVAALRAPRAALGWNLDSLAMLGVMTTDRPHDRPLAFGPYLYIAHFSLGLVSIFLTQARVLIAQIRVGRQPLRPVAAGGLIWIANSGDNSLSIFNPNAIPANPHSAPIAPAFVIVGTGPRRPFLDGGRLFVSNSGDGTISVIDLATQQIIATIVGQGHVAHPQRPAILGTVLYLVSKGEHRISGIDTQSLTEVANILVGHGPLRPVGHLGRLYVSIHAGKVVVVIEAGQPNRELKVGRRPSRPVAAGNFVYVTSRDAGEVVVIDGTTGTIATTIEVGCHPLRPVVVGDYLVVASSGSRDVHAGELTIISRRTHTVITRRQFPLVPHRPLLVGDALYVSFINSQIIQILQMTEWLGHPAETQDHDAVQ